MVRQYLENELRMHRWIQLPFTELNELEEQLEIEIGDGHHYTDPTSNVPMVELHVDSHPTFHERMNATSGSKCTWTFALQEETWCQKTRTREQSLSN